MPVETGYFSLHGLSKQLETLNILCERCGQRINVRVVASMYDIRTKMAREIMVELRSCFGDRMLKTIVNFNTKIKEAASFGQPIGEYAPASKGRSDFVALAEEVIASESMQQRRELVNSLSIQLDDISSSADELLSSTKPAVAVKRPIVDKPSANKKSSAAMESVAAVKAASTSLLTSKAEEQRESESVKSAEVSKPAEETVKAVAETPAISVSTEEKLSDYYGVNQMNAAVVFVTLYPRARKVQIAGDFNNWQPEKTEMQKIGDSGVWQTKLSLPPGKHQYRLVVDGQWQQDPYNERTELNPFGGFNSVIEVK
ncbi:1,4-alpha-glucan branching enzyme GlgB [subsurface metagenome]